MRKFIVILCGTLFWNNVKWKCVNEIASVQIGMTCFIPCNYSGLNSPKTDPEKTLSKLAKKNKI